MTKNNTKQTKKITFGIFSILALCLCFMFGVFIGATPVKAYTKPNTTWSNLNFSDNGNVSSVYANPTGWKKGFPDSPATSGAINLASYNNENFNLDSGDLPAKINDDADNYVLMINSKHSTNKNGLIPGVQYYENSSPLSLDAYSNYKIIIWTKVLQGAQASIYVTGLENDLGFERIDYDYADQWTPYTFYITTGKNKETIKTQLWLGSKPENTSLGAVFFDNISVYQISNDETPAVETSADNYVAKPATSGDRVKYINLDERQLVPNINADFESTDLSDWTRTNAQMQEGTYYEVLNLSSSNVSVGKGIEHLGLDLSKNNSKALVLYTTGDTKSYFGLRSESIDLPLYETLKISIKAKVGKNNTGSAYVKFVENDVLDYNGDVIEAITPVTKQITISSNETNNYTNNYNTCTFYIKGRSLYNTSFRIELWLGSETAEASGVVAFDNITVEHLSDSEYESASTNSYSLKFALQSKTDTYGVTNSTFNTVQKANTELTYPLIPSNWTHTYENEADIYYGVVNTSEAEYEAHKAEFGNFGNPGNPEGFGSVETDTNNILLMYNFNPTHQSVTSSTFSVDKNAYYKLSFAYKLLATNMANKEILNVYIVDEDDNILYSDEKIVSDSTNSVWTDYNVYISTNSYSNSLKLIISLGAEDDDVEGIVYIDNVTSIKDSNLTKADYEQLAESENVLDFEEGNFNLVEKNNTDLYTALRYTGNLEAGENQNVARGGIINALNTTDEFEIEASPENNSTLKYLMMIQSFDTATYSMTARDSLDLETDNYYKFTIWAKTVFAGTSTEPYGAEFGLDGIEEKITGIVADEWTKYTIYVSCTTSTTVNLKFALTSADTDTIGMVYFDNFGYETVEKDEYNVQQLNNSEDPTFLFVGDTELDEEDLNPEEKTQNNSVALWYAIPTVLLALSLIVALIAYFMQKIKITKWESKKVNQYDRESTLHRDVLRTEAEQLRNQRVKEVKSQIAEYEQQMTKMEEEHQDELKAKRAERRTGVSAKDEKEFKQYAKRHTAIENRIATLSKEIDNMNTAEYLLSVQHQLAVEKAKKERIAKEKSYKNKNK